MVGAQVVAVDRAYGRAALRGPQCRGLVADVELGGDARRVRRDGAEMRVPCRRGIPNDACERESERRHGLHPAWRGSELMGVY